MAKRYSYINMNLLIDIHLNIMIITRRCIYGYDRICVLLGWNLTEGDTTIEM